MYFNKKSFYGVSITPGIGLEVAQVDSETNTLLGYVSKPLDFNINLCSISDMDIFKDTLESALQEIDAPKGSEICISLPPAVFQIRDWPASMNDENIVLNITDELAEEAVFQNSDEAPHFAYTKLSNSTIQTSKIAYAATSKSMAVEMAMQVKDLDYKLKSIDISVNSLLNALTYTGKVDVAPDSSWVLLIVDDYSTKVIPMQGRNYVDCFEERISIGEVLGDAENYDIVVSAVNPVLSRVPSQLLYVISKTNLINAQMLADKLIYNAQIVHLDANLYSSKCLIDASEALDSNAVRAVSPDVIGAAIRPYLQENPTAKMDLFNAELGDIYISQAPITYKGFELSILNMSILSGIFFGLALVIFIIVSVIVNKNISNNTAEIQKLNAEIAVIKKFIEENDIVSTSSFDVNDEIRIGVAGNKNVYSYYTIVGTEIPQKLWLTALKFGDSTVIEGQADNLESVYSFFRNIKDYDPTSPIKLQKLSLAGGSGFSMSKDGDMDTASILTSLNADYYAFKIADKEDAAPGAKKNSGALAPGLTDVPDDDLN